jgi:hypothetical protein
MSYTVYIFRLYGGDGKLIRTIKMGMKTHKDASTYAYQLLKRKEVDHVEYEGGNFMSNIQKLTY